MKKHILWAIVAVLLLCTGPALTQGNDDDKFAKPQIDVISDIVEQTEPVDTKSSQEKDKKRHPEDIGASSQDSKTETDATDSAYADTDASEGPDADSPRQSKRSRRRRAAEESVARPEIIEEIQGPEKPPLKPEPVIEAPTQPEKPTLESPKPAAQPDTPPKGQVPPPEKAPSQEQKPQEQAKPNVQGQPGQVNMQQQAPAQEKAQQQPPTQQQQPRAQQPPVQQQPPKPQQQPPQEPVQNQQPKPAEQVPQQQQQANQHIPEVLTPEEPEPEPEVEPEIESEPEVEPEPVYVPPVQQAQPVQPPRPAQQAQPAQPAQPARPAQQAQQAQPAAPAKQESASSGSSGHKARDHVVDDMMDDEQYMNLYGHEDNYLDQYTVYSETFYTHVERFCKEALVPIYHHIRTTPELSLGFSTLAVIYFVNLFFRILGRIFRKKPKFVYNREEVMSHADINNNFKKFVTELDNLKKQLDTNAKKGGSAPAHSGEPATPGTATIPQSLQNEISYIAQNLSKNDDLFNKIAKDRKQLDSFLFEFQKEVVESHKAIWNELYQLRKVFSQSRLNMSTSTLKARSEARDTDDTKSLSSNPDTETRRREDREPIKKSTEPRSRSVANPETVGLRSKQPAPKERKPVQDVEPEKPASALHQNGNSAEPHVPHIHKEEPPVEKAPAQDPFAAKQPEPEETQPEEVQIPTNLADKAPTHNPFATSAQSQTTPTPTPTIQNAGPTPGPGLPFGGPKGIPFGAKGRPPVAKQPVIQTTFSHAPEPAAVNSGAKVESIPDLNSGIKPTTPVQTTFPPLHAAPAHAEPQQEKAEEKSALPETDHAPEETKAAERLSGADEMLAGGNAGGEEEGAGDASTASRPGIPQLRGGPPGPMGGPMGGPPGQRKPVIPTNKALPIPGRKVGLPGANVFKGPPGNIPRAAVPTTIKQPQGQVQDTAPKTGV